MKLVLALLAVLAGVWLWRRGRAGGMPRSGQRDPPKTQAPPMVRCSRCGIYVPGDQAVAGRQGSYCSVNHRQDAERT
jgi:uncharacterized protein